MSSTRPLCARLAIAGVATFALSAPILLPAHAEVDTAAASAAPTQCTPASRVLTSVFSADGNVDNALTMDHTPTATTPTDEPDQFGSIELAQGATLIDSGNYATYTTSRTGRTFNVTTTVIAAAPSGIGGSPDLSLIPYLSVSTDPVSAANNGGAMAYSFAARSSAQVGDTYTVYFQHTLQGDSDDPLNTGGNTTRIFYTGYRVRIVAANNCAPIVYDANGGTIRGNATYSDTLPITGTARFTNQQLISDIPTRDGYTFMSWVNTDTPGGSPRAYSAGDPIILNTSASTYTWDQIVDTNTFRAIWAPNFSLSYDSDGGDTTPAPATGHFPVYRTTGIPVLTSLNRRAADAPTRTGYTFDGWKDLISGETFAPNDPVALTTVNPARVLTAQWIQDPAPTPSPTTPTTPAPTSAPASPSPAIPSTPVPPSTHPTTPVVPGNSSSTHSTATTTSTPPRLARTGANPSVLFGAAGALTVGLGALILRRRHH